MKPVKSSCPAYLQDVLGMAIVELITMKKML